MSFLISAPASGSGSGKVDEKTVKFQVLVTTFEMPHTGRDRHRTGSRGGGGMIGERRLHRRKAVQVWYTLFAPDVGFGNIAICALLQLCALQSRAHAHLLPTRPPLFVGFVSIPAVQPAVGAFALLHFQFHFHLNLPWICRERAWQNQKRQQ